jgi:tRNA nucleotidyltransferase/poly(A) polymerase
MNSKFKYFKVGGCVRDFLMGVPSKDIDLVAIGGTFEELEKDVIEQGGKIFVSKPEYLTVRCSYPEVGPCDIRLARKDGDYTDGRRPDQVFLAEDVKEDIFTRDFKMNAILQDITTGEIIDYVGGVEDIKNKIISTVGDAGDRFSEDFLRLIRAVRFSITKGFRLDTDIQSCLMDEMFLEGLTKISEERIYEELLRCFKFSTWQTLQFLDSYQKLKECLFENERFGIWLKPSLEQK